MSEPESTQRRVSKAELAALLKRIGAVAQSEKTEEPDTLALAEKGELIQTGQEWLRESLQQIKDLHIARLRLLTGLFRLIICWLLSVVTLLVLLGFGSLTHFSLSDKVVITYITSTTASVLGLFIIAAKWLYSEQSALNQAKQQYLRSPKGDR